MNSVVSIITPSFNRANIVHETAESIFNQTYPHWEWVITDDGSTDNSWEVLQQFAAKDSRVKIFQRNRTPKGACTCRNISVENCTGDYVLFLDTDDLLASYCLEQRVRTIEQYPDCDFVIFPMLLFKQMPDDLKLLWNIDTSQDDIERILMGDPICQGTGTLWKKSTFIEIGMWNEHLLLWQDIELHLRSLLAGINYVKRLDLKPDAFLRISDISLSRTGYHSLPKFLSRLKVLEETGESIRQKNLFSKYVQGLKHMFIDLYINAVSSGYIDEVKVMLKMGQEWMLFSNLEMRTLYQFAFIYQYKLYKIPFIRKKNLQTLRQIGKNQESTLGKIIYSQPSNFYFNE